MTSAESPPRKRRWGRSIMVAAVAVVTLLSCGAVAAEVLGRRTIEHSAAEMLADQGIDGARVSLGGPWWRPVVLTAVIGGTVAEVTVDIEQAEVAGVKVARGHYVLEDLDVDPDLGSRTLGVDSMRRGTFRLLLAPDSVGDEMGVEVRIIDGRLVVGPDEEPAKLRVDGEELVLESPYLQRLGHPPRIAALSARLLPCPPDVAIIGGHIALTCVGTRLPAVLDQSLGEPVANMPAPPELEPPLTAERGDGD